MFQTLALSPPAVGLVRLRASLLSTLLVGALALAGVPMAAAEQAPAGAEQAPPPVEERPPITSTQPAEPKPSPPPKPKAPAPPAAKRPSCLLPDAEYQALMAVKNRALAACENTYLWNRVQQCRKADREWEAELARKFGPGSLGERRAKGRADPPPAPPAPSAFASSSPKPVPGPPPAESASAAPPPEQKPAPKEDGSVGPQCPPAVAPLGKGKSTPRDNYLDRVAMHLLLPGLYKQSGVVTPALPPGRIAWVIAHAMAESMGSAQTNILNVQYNSEAEAARHGVRCKKGEPRLEYLSPTDKGYRVDGWAPSSEGKFLTQVFICDPVYPDTVAAVNDYLARLKDKWPRGLTALTSPSATLKDFAEGLRGYGTGESYKKPPPDQKNPRKKPLQEELPDRLRELAGYLGRRLEALRLAAPCDGGLKTEIAALEAARAAALAGK